MEPGRPFPSKAHLSYCRDAHGFLLITGAVPDRAGECKKVLTFAIYSGFLAATRSNDCSNMYQPDEVKSKAQLADTPF